MTSPASDPASHPASKPGASESTGEARRTPRAPRVIGVLGGIAAGKSLVAALLAGPEGVVLDADRLARELLDGPAGVAFVRERFGPEVLDAASRVDRARLAARVFADPAARQALEDWTHPRVRERISAELDGARARGVPRIVLDVPLLLENEARHGLVLECAALVFVDADAELRDRRAVRERNWKPGEVARREAAQMRLADKRARADFTIENRGDRAELEGRVAAVLRALEQRSR